MSKYDFNPKHHQTKLLSILKELSAAKKLTSKLYQKILKKHPKNKSDIFSKSEVISAIRHFKHPQRLIAKIQAKPIRTMSGVVPVTLLTKPYPCPGKCIFCPNDPNMPKSYLSSEPGAQRAALNRFDPYHQVYNRLKAYYSNGHTTDKAELIVLGGTWSAYPVKYKIWFIKHCFDALNDFQPGKIKKLTNPKITGVSNWESLKKSQLKNQTASARCIGLSLETRPDFISKSQLIEFRKLGCTKVQIGIQSLDNQVLKLNKRGHSIKETQEAINLLRLAGFKIQAHWMANLYGSNPKEDIADFKKLFSQKLYRPDELKIYPTSLIASAELNSYYQKGLWQPYSQNQLLKVLTAILPTIPEYCRVTRVIRDFSSDDIVVGNKATNFRQIVEKEIANKGKTIQEIRVREIRQKKVSLKDLKLKTITYQTATSTEKFFQFVTSSNQIAAFLRLSLPKLKPFISELKSSAIIREIHVYGQALSLGEKAKTQHLGLGTKLISKAKTTSQKNHYKKLSVISAIGTMPYYRSRGFKDGQLYQHLNV